MKICTFCLFYFMAFTFFPVHTNAQQKQKDSLLNLLKKTKQDTTKVNLLNQLSKYTGESLRQYDASLNYAQQAKSLAEKINFKKGLAYSYDNLGNLQNSQSEFQKALQNHTTALKLHKEVNDKYGIAASHHNIGNDYFFMGDYPATLENYQAALQIRIELNEKQGIADSYSNMAFVYQVQGNIPEALQNCFKALKIYEETNDRQGIAFAHNNIGYIYNGQGDYTNAIKNYQSALKIFEDLNDKYGAASANINIGLIYFAYDNLNDALKSYLSGLRLYKEINNKQGVAVSYNNIGNIYLAQKNYPEALRNYTTALNTYNEIGSKLGIAEIQLNLGELNIKQNRAAEGKAWILKGLELSREMEDKGRIRNSYLQLATADSILGNYKGAFENYKIFIAYRDSLFNEENTRKITEATMQYEFDKKEAATKAKQERKDIRQKNIRNAAFAAIVTLLLFSLVVMRQRNKVKKEKKRSDKLLLNILPAEVADELKTKGAAAAKQFDDVTVLFTDFVNFTQTAEHLSPQQLVQELNACFTAFDEITERNGLEKIKTVGDAYIAVCGLPLSDPLHAQKAIKAALEIRNFIEERKKTQNVFEIRIGVNSGSVVAGIVGVKKFAYDIWGDTVNTAARMESNGQPGKVNISEATYRLVKDDFTCTHRGKISAKGKGEVDMYFVEKNN